MNLFSAKKKTLFERISNVRKTCSEEGWRKKQTRSFRSPQKLGHCVCVVHEYARKGRFEELLRGYSWHCSTA